MTLAVLSVASEAVPLIKTGGLADVVGALPAAVAPHEIAMTTMLPGYPAVIAALGKRPRVLHKFGDMLGHAGRLLSGQIGGHPLLVVDVPTLFARDGGPYADTRGTDWEDNWLRFAVFARAAADVAAGRVKGRAFDIIHAHDWQAAMALAYLRYAAADAKVQPRRVMTIHNMAFQGNFDAAIFPLLGLPKSAWSIDGVEYHKGVSFLKAGLASADAITTVSPSYAAEIRTPEYGMGLEGLIVARGTDVHGILNGIDPLIWNAASDPLLVQNYTTRSLSRKPVNTRALEPAFDLEPGKGPLFVIISRLTWQKGMDVLLDVLDHLVGMGGRLALLGSGDAALEAGFHAAAARHPGKIGVRIGYDEALSHVMLGGGDAILIPSRFEPCGLTQLYGLAYGCVPVVARTGGLADTVIDANIAALATCCATGLQFAPVDVETLTHAITRAVTLHADHLRWHRLQTNGMKADFSWARSGRAYADLYIRLVSDG
jgi:starch synthase